MDSSTGGGLQRVRRVRGLTQDQLARASGVSIRTIASLESGAAGRPRADTVRRLARALDLEWSALDRILSGSRSAVASGIPLGADLLVGREDDIRRLDASVGRAGLVVVTGPGGVGKTALCLRWLDQAGVGFPDGVLYVDLLGFTPDTRPQPPEVALRRLLLQLGEDASTLPAGAEELTACYRAATRDRRLLVLLDNARSSGQVRPLLPAGPGSRTLVTSRRRLDGLVARDGADQLTLAPLELPAAVALLAARMAAPPGREPGDRPAAPPGRASDDRFAVLAEACGRLPLALLILATRLSRRPDQADVGTWAAPGAAELDLLEVEDGDQSVRRVLDATAQALPAEGREMLGLLGLWPRVVLDHRSAAALLGTTARQAARTLDSLADLHLVQEVGARQYRFHDLVAAYLAERSAELTAERRAAAVRRLCRHHLVVLLRCTRILAPDRTVPFAEPAPEPDAAAPDPPELRTAADVGRYFDRTEPAVTAVVRLARREGLDRYAWELLYAAQVLYTRRGPLPEYLQNLEAVLPEVPGDHTIRPLLLNHLGIASAIAGRLEQAKTCWQQALALTDDADDRASNLTNIATADLELGDPVRALAGYEEALALRRPLDNPVRLVITLFNVGRLKRVTGDLAGARADHEECLRIGEEVDSLQVIGPALLELGVVHAEAGRLDAAADCLDRAVRQARATADGPLEAEAHERRAGVLPAGSAAALAHLRAARRLYAAVGDPRADRLAADPRLHTPAAGPTRAPA